jgi:flagella basal body P-ring formation protein FlgA
MGNLSKNIRCWVFAVLGILVILQGWHASVFAADEQTIPDIMKIIVKETGQVKGPRVRLKEVAEIHANGMLKEAIEKIDLGFSPKPGRLKSIDRKKILSVIRAQRYLPENIEIICPEQVYVKRMSQKIDKNEIRQFIDQDLSQRFKDREYELIAFSVQGLDSYPVGRKEYRFDSNDYIDTKGRVSVFLDVMVDGNKEDRIKVTGEVAVYEKAVLASRSLARGDVLSKDSVYQEKKNIFELNDNLVQDFDAIVGKILRSSVKRDEVLTARLLSEPPLVRKGDIIRLVSRNHTLLIVTSGISKEDGVENSTIRVENLSSGKLVRGIVKGKSRVEVIQ